MRLAPLAIALSISLTGCGSTGPSGREIPALGVYDVSMSGQFPSGGAWTRTFGMELIAANDDSLTLRGVDGDLPADIMRTASWNVDAWHTIFGLFNAPDIIIRIAPGARSCEGRLFVDFGASYPATACAIARRMT